jgi:hypothetical protein
MAEQAIRAGWWAALLFATALRGAQAQLTPADAGTQGTASPSANGNYLGSHLVSPKSESSCPPNIGPYRADAIVTGTDMRQRPWGFAQTLREVLVKLSGDPRLKDNPRTARPVRDHPNHSVDAAAQTRPRTGRVDPQDLGGGCLCPERGKHAALALPGGPECRDKADGRGLVQASMGRAGCPTVSIG